MTVKRIVANIAAGSVDEVRSFYAELFGLKVVMDQGWIVTLASGGTAPTQLGVATEGGSGTAVRDLSIEDVDAVHEHAEALDLAIEYGPIDEPRGVRRFHLRDPRGKLLNVLSHPS